MTTDYNELLAALGHRLGMDALGLNTNGVCSLQFDDRLAVHIEPDDNGATLQVYSVLAAIPATPEARERLYAVLLEANLFARGTGGGALGIDPDSAEVILSQSVDVSNTSHHAFLDLVEIHINTAEIWLRRLERLDDEFLIAPTAAPEREHLHHLKV